MKRRLKHGASRNGHRWPEYASWSNMISRCTNTTNKDYASYGGRGICVCDRWRQSFQNFLADMGRKPLGARTTLDRFPNNDGNYEPGNCRWATQQEQMGNTRRNQFITYKEETHNLYTWALKIGVRPRTLYTRIRRGWNAERILEPTNTRKRNEKGQFR